MKVCQVLVVITCLIGVLNAQSCGTCSTSYGSGYCWIVQSGNTVGGYVGTSTYCLNLFSNFNPTINSGNSYAIYPGNQVCIPASCANSAYVATSSSSATCSCGYGSSCYTVQSGNTVSGLVGTSCLSTFTAYNPNVNVNNGYALSVGQQVCIPNSCTSAANTATTCSNYGYYGYNAGSYAVPTSCGSCYAGTCYTVRSGDTLNNLVGPNCVNSVATTNGLANPNVITVGQTLCIPYGCNSYVSSLNTYNNGYYYNGGSNGVTCSGTVVTVQCGNTVGGFVGQNQACINAIAQANGLAYPSYTIQAGQSLCLPAGCNGYYSNFGVNTNTCGLVSSYSVVSGDTCNSIAAHFGITVAQLYQCNPAINSGCTNLAVGQVLAA